MSYIVKDLVNNKLHYLKDGKPQVVGDLIYPSKIVRSLEGNSHPIVEMTEISSRGVRVFEMNTKSLMSQSETISELILNGYYFSFKYANPIRDYIMREMQKVQTAGKEAFNHKGLGFTTINSNKVFLLNDCIGSGTSAYYSKKLSFKNGTDTDYEKFIKDSILPYTPLQTALVIGLSSVLASDIDGHADIKTIVINMCGASSTGKTTTAQFIASLWGNPEISSSGFVKTFNATQNSIFKSIEGINGVPIILDDATAAAYLNRGQLIYQLAQGEARARLGNYGTETVQGDSWSGLSLITSEAPILSDAEHRQGLIARVIDTDNIVWTTSGEHSSSIKRFINTNYGHIGRKFVIEYLKLSSEEVIKKFDASKEIILEKIRIKDNLTDRVVSKLAVLYTTAILIKDLLGYDLELEKILETLIKFDQSSADSRHIGLKALDAVKFHIHRNFHAYNIYSIEQCFEHFGKGKAEGRIEFEKKLMKVTIPAERIREILQNKHFYEYENILKYWGSNNIIRKQSSRHTINMRGFDNRVVQFMFEYHEDHMISWYGDIETELTKLVNESESSKQEVVKGDEDENQDT